jgi:hypothetical protein
MSLTPTCVADGTAAVGSACTIDNTGADDCMKGGTCVDGLLRGTGMAVCRKICASDTDCTNGSKCAGVVMGLGECLPTCNLFSNDCGAGQTCADIRRDISGTGMMAMRFPTCRPTGTGLQGDACMASADCGDNLVCLRKTMTCEPLCDNTHMCPADPSLDGGTATCTPQNGLPNMAGVCN